MTTEENPDEQSQTEPTEQPDQTAPAEETEGNKPLDQSDQTCQTELFDQSEENEQSDQIEQTDQAEPAEEPSSGSKPEEQLQAILEAAKTSRLAPADEYKAVELLKQTIVGGPKALPASLDAILSLPWSASVKAVADAWPETKPAGRARLLTGLAKADSDASRRIRLSLARGLHAQDPGRIP